MKGAKEQRKDLMKKMREYRPRLGTDMSDIKLEPHNPIWAEFFELGKQRLEQILGSFNEGKRIFPEGVKVHHVGSTSIPTIALAKPVIDICVETPYNEWGGYYDFRFKSMLEAEGFFEKGDTIEDGYFRVIDPANSNFVFAHIHVWDRENSASLMRFKRYMLEHPEDAEKYAELKQKNLAATQRVFADESYPLGRAQFFKEEYYGRKESFLQEVVAKAKEIYG